jgi:hypothetical protein
MNPNTRIAYTKEDGTVAIVIPTPEFIAKGGTLEQLISKCVPGDVVSEVYDAEDIPKDRYFRDAWVLDSQVVGQGIQVHRATAEQIHLNKLRVIRDDKLKAEDIEYQKALEFRDDAAMNAIANKKKKLRYMPDEVDFSGLSLDALKDFVPDVLK